MIDLIMSCTNQENVTQYIFDNTFSSHCKILSFEPTS